MIRRYAAVFRLTLMVADLVLAMVVLAGAAVARFGLDRAYEGWDDVLRDPRLAFIGFLGTWIVTLWLHGLYRPRSRWTLRQEVKDVLRATLVFTLVILSLLYVFKLPDVSRLLLVYVFPSLAIAAVGIRIVLRMILSVLRDVGRNTRYLLVVGANRRARAFADMIDGHPELGLAVLGHIKADASDNGVELTHELLGTVDELENILHTRIVDEVAICLPFAKEELIEQAARLCEQEGRIVRIPVAPVEHVLSLGRLESIDGIGIYTLVNGPDKTAGLIVKRAIDIVGATAAIVLLSPIFAILAVLVRLDSSGPVLFRQDRVGVHGRVFKVVKFRSMCADAEERLDGLRDLNEIQGHAFKLDNDPRITRMGRLLRKTSLDELPQFWNVLRGQMSLVGPRPPLPSEVANYDIWHRRRLSMKPGITGLWQIGARHEPEFDRWVEKDLEYIDSWSLWLDLKIMARTVPAMLTGR